MYVFRFFERFSPILALKLTKCLDKLKKFFQKFIMGYRKMQNFMLSSYPFKKVPKITPKNFCTA
jgi:hypothetical protein